MENLINLPWQVQLVIASGYAAYSLSYVGIRSHHSSIEIAFSTLIFGLVTVIALYVLFVFKIKDVFLSTILAFLFTVAAGFLWRRFGRGLLRATVRKIGVSESDDDPSAWTALFDGHNCVVSQIAVRLTDGSWIRCDDTRLFKDEPFGPCLLGGTGDLIIYPTHIVTPSGIVRPQLTTINNHGTRSYYIPKETISYMSVRHRKR